MGEYKSLEEVAEVIGDGGPFTPDISFETVEELVEAIVSMGNEPKVFAYHDDHLGLKDNLSADFMSSKIVNVDKNRFSCDIEEVLSQANTIIRLSNRVLSEDDEEGIREDEQTRGNDDY
ncbi:TPA: hypothetical protein L9M57_001563 [Klebsiella quasipneumoniae subsp. similipneumoniae]|nr:hypothetical protein [Klebsiella quasipneumoniae subsp. similipneumoniae]